MKESVMRRVQELRSPPSDDGTAVAPTPLFSRQAGPLALAAGVLIIVAQLIWLQFEQRQNAATARHPVYQTGNVIYLAGFCVLLLAVIAVYGREAHRAGRLGVAGVTAALLGTMLLGGDLWFESFAVPWLAEGPTPQVLTYEPSALLAAGAVSSYLLFAVGWILFGIASIRARVFPVALSVLLVIGGIAGYNALLAPFGLPLGVAVAALGAWLMRRSRQQPE
jgi:hypothetical protein